MPAVSVVPLIISLRLVAACFRCNRLSGPYCLVDSCDSSPHPVSQELSPFKPSPCRGGYGSLGTFFFFLPLFDRSASPRRTSCFSLRRAFFPVPSRSDGSNCWFPPEELLEHGRRDVRRMSLGAIFGALPASCTLRQSCTFRKPALAARWSRCLWPGATLSDFNALQRKLDLRVRSFQFPQNQSLCRLPFYLYLFQFPPVGVFWLCYCISLLCIS